MKIYYYCYARAHSSVVAGYIHLNRLPSSRIPTIEELMAIREFDKSEGKDWGIPYFLGDDERHNQVYIIGLGKDRPLALQAIYHILNEYGNPLDYRFFNTLEQIDWVTRIGGFLSRSLGLVAIGRRLSALGIQRSYFGLTKLVKRAKELN
jgi:hypothetical protein